MGPSRSLSELVQQLNGRFGTQSTEADRLFFEQVTASAAEVYERLRDDASS